MSVIYVDSDSEFAILDEPKYYNEIFDGLNVEIRRELFEIHSKFMPDSQFEAIQKRGISERKRRKNSENSDDVINWIQNLSTRIQKIGVEIGYFEKEIDISDNNKNARKAAEKVMTSSIFQPMTSSEQIEEFSGSSIQEIDNFLCGGMVSNWVRRSENAPGILEDSQNQKFYIPKNSTFHIGDVINIEQFSTINDLKFDLIIADPPWFCRSVKRKKTYQMSEEIIDQIDFPKISNGNSLLVFWITNRKGIEEEMESRLQKWGFEVLGNWKWLKVTTQGEPVYDFGNSKHKVPFENLILAVKKGGKKFDLPAKFVFASIPMAIHSHKPPLLEFLKHFGLEFERPLELFARSLLPDTHSIGLETILLQSEHVFRPKQTNQ